MGKCIDRETMLQFISEALGENAYCDDALYEYVLQGAKSLPVADMVEVVRCKDCIHRPSRIYGAEDEREGFNLEFPDGWCPMQCEDGWYNRMPRDDFFCGYGERKEKNNG